MKRIMFFGWLVAGVLSTDAVAAEAAEGKVVGPGVTWRSEFIPEGPLNFNVMRIEIDNPHVTLETESGKDRLFVGEKVLSSVKREAEPGHTEIIGAVNADFWASTPRSFTPIGLLVADGMIYNMPAKKRSAFVFTENETPFIGPVTLNVLLTSDGEALRIDRINSGTDDDHEIVLFTEPYGDVVPPAVGKRFVLTMEGNEFLPNQPVSVMIKSVDADSTMPLSRQDMVLHIPPGSSDVAASLSSIRKAVLSADMPEVEGVVRSVCGGAPSIVSNGRVNIAHDEGMGESFAETKHPRTALGITKDKNTIYLVTVDGRQPRLSVGVALDELARYMVDLGCWEAINLDGGGSTSMVVGDKIVNEPSDFFGPRTVANSLLVVAEASTGKPESLSFEPTGKPLVVPAGTTLTVDIQALDENSVPVPLGDDPEISYSESKLVADMKLEGTRAMITFSDEPGRGTLQFSIGDARGKLPLKVVELDKVATEPDVLVLGKGDTVEVHVQASANGERVKLDPEMIHLKSTDQEIVSTSGTQVQGLSKGRGGLALTIGAHKSKVPVFVELAEARQLEDFDDVAGLVPLEGSNFDKNNTTVTLNQDEVKEGRASVQLDYTLTRGGRSRLHIPVDSSIREAPAALALWVYGDGKEAWVRANLVDDKGTTFIAAFTSGADGITWKDEWRHLSVPYQSLIGTDFTKSPRPVLPLRVEDLVIAQDQEVLKRSGSILLDGFEALYPPAE